MSVVQSHFWHVWYRTVSRIIFLHSVFDKNIVFSMKFFCFHFCFFQPCYHGPFSVLPRKKFPGCCRSRVWYILAVREIKGLSQLSLPADTSGKIETYEINTACSKEKTLFIEKISTRNLQPTPKKKSKLSVKKILLLNILISGFQAPSPCYAFRLHNSQSS